MRHSALHIKLPSSTGRNPNALTHLPPLRAELSVSQPRRALASKSLWCQQHSRAKTQSAVRSWSSRWESCHPDIPLNLLASPRTPREWAIVHPSRCNISSMAWLGSATLHETAVLRAQLVCVRLQQFQAFLASMLELQMQSAALTSLRDLSPLASKNMWRRPSWTSRAGTTRG